MGEAAAMDSVDRSLLNVIQWDFPLVERPYAALGDAVGLKEAEVMGRLQRLKDDRVIRQISAIFDTRALGYKSSLVAMKLSSDCLDKAARIVNGHPGVSHNYKRQHPFNLWFTVAVEPTSDIKSHVDALHRLTGAEETLPLPTLKLFKIGVRLDMGDGLPTEKDDPEDIYSEEDRQRGASFALSPLDIGIVRELQEDIALVPQPFGDACHRLGITPEALFERCRILKDMGKLRRVAAILHHRRAGYRANGMGVWAVPTDSVDKVGALVANYRNVSHCYLRPIYRNWPYNLFSMIHARTRDQCRRVAEDISKEAGIDRYDILYSTVEYKKVRLRLFTPDFARWEAEHLRGEPGMSGPPSPVMVPG